ncbi:MAG: hypothetical protein HOV80_15060 [Polyangiaceae bacterium]|nr:hypothetical protein [Polyangiaceae bacterium]
MSRLRDAVRAFGARTKPYLPALAVSAVLAYLAIRNILEDAGRPAMPLDDSFIHLVYARRFGEGAPFTFSPDGGFSSGATSFLWPLALTPFWLIGFRGLSLVWAAWLLGTVLHAALAVETKRLAEPLVGRSAAIGAAAMSLLFGANAWFAWSGMETIALAWIMTRTARVTSELAETAKHARSRRLALGVALAGAACPLIRPEGGLLALVAALGLLVFAPPAAERFGRGVGALVSRAYALIPLAGVAIVPLLNIALTGHGRSNTAIVKWAIGNPYYQGERLYAFITGNIKMLLTELLAGGPFTAIFLPEQTHWVMLAGLIALPFAAWRTRRVPRALAVLAIVLGTLIPCTFITILWNRVRYIWPFAPGWFVLIACLGAEVQALLSRRFRNVELVAPLITGVFAGALASKLTWSLNDLANSARAIDAQQVRLGMWAEDHLPKDARIGVNDTGAIAYFSERATFDVVGLTTEGEAKYWVAGSGSRYEHYERMPLEKLPTHFIVYPGWMGIQPVLGERLFEATVTNQSILGGATKVAYVADWSVLGRGNLPISPQPTALLVAELDVSDLESEAEHRYAVGTGTTENDNTVSTFYDEKGDEICDGGRHRRALDRFYVDLTPGKSARMVLRLSAPGAVNIDVSASGETIGHIEAPLSSWSEHAIEIPRASTGPGTKIEVRATGWADSEAPEEAPSFGSMHYWFYEGD